MTINIVNSFIHKNACIFVQESSQEKALQSLFMRLSKYIYVICYYCYREP